MIFEGTYSTKTREVPEQVDHVDVNDKTWCVGDKVLYIPNHAFAVYPKAPADHPGCERGVITSLRSDGSIWVRYESQHITQPGQKTPVNNLRFL